MYAQTQPEPQKPLRKSTWMDTAQLVVSILVFIAFLGWAGLCFFALAQGQTTPAFAEFVPGMWAMAFSFLILSGIAFTSILSSRQVYYERAQKCVKPNRGAWLKGTLILLPLLVLAGFFVMKANNPPAFLLPLITILTLAVTALWLLRMGQGEGWAQNTKRDSGLFTFGMSFGALFIMIIQMLMVVVLVLLAILIFSQQADMVEAFKNLQLNTQNPDLLLEELSKTAVGPIVAIGLFVLVSLIAPLSEELFKTLGVWFLKGRPLSPSEGWNAGLMCGAGFGLIEGFLFSIQGLLAPSYEEWLYFVLGRIGGLLLHTVLGGIIGYALSKSWREKRPGLAVVAYLIAMLIHGTWNFVATSQVTLAALFKLTLPDVVVYIVLAILLIAMVIVLIAMRRKVWHEERVLWQTINGQPVFQLGMEEKMMMGQRE